MAASGEGFPDPGLARLAGWRAGLAAGFRTALRRAGFLGGLAI
jgi:hypothetical protein